jgi:hypothetical protein
MSGQSHVLSRLQGPGIRDRPPYNYRHTYATIGAMSGLNPAFIARLPIGTESAIDSVWPETIAPPVIDR